MSDSPRPIDPQLLEILVCPQCHSELRLDESAQTLTCVSDDCGLCYPIRDGIPVLLIDEAQPGPTDG